MREAVNLWGRRIQNISVPSAQFCNEPEALKNKVFKLQKGKDKMRKLSAPDIINKRSLSLKYRRKRPKKRENGLEIAKEFIENAP